MNRGVLEARLGHVRGPEAQWMMPDDSVFVLLLNGLMSRISCIASTSAEHYSAGKRLFWKGIFRLSRHRIDIGRKAHGYRRVHDKMNKGCIAKTCP